LDAENPTRSEVMKKIRNQVLLNHFNKHTSENICHKIKQYQRQRIALYEALTGQEKITLIDIDPYTRTTPMHQIFYFISSLLAKSSLQKEHFTQEGPVHTIVKPFYN
jgi:ABC-type nitrate/sulfonate/bicarbonate transport system ATPase subunit